jgi:hypothetical protein
VRPGGRMVLLTWRGLAENEWIREFAIAMAAGRDLPAPPANVPGPFALSDPERVRAILTGAGWVDVGLEALNESMWFGGDVDEAFDFVLGISGWMLKDVEGEARERALQALRASMAAHLGDDGVRYGSAGWLVRAGRP